MNKTVSRKEVSGFAIKIKSIHNNTIIYQTTMKDLE
jgi:hypothetical protein